VVAAHLSEQNNKPELARSALDPATVLHQIVEAEHAHGAAP
jgi:hypothetical protein